jgi:hypothetical protein
MMKLAYQEVLPDNVCSNLLGLQKEAGLLSWNKAGENEFIFACHLANKLEIKVTCDPFNNYIGSLKLQVNIAGIKTIVSRNICAAVKRFPYVMKMRHLRYLDTYMTNHHLKTCHWQICDWYDLQ